MLNDFFKAVLEEDQAPIVICNLNHNIVYMNPAALEKYGVDLVGKSIFCCHSKDSNEKIGKVISWFTESIEHNRIFTSHNPEENKDVYMVALRNDQGKLIGYYEKHEYRSSECNSLYNFT